ncbi:MAG: hypothetical protein ACFFBD_09890 [Candidatus Hodarchaeota archaeon]
MGQKKDVPEITVDDLKPCDVIMCHGDDWLAKLIQTLDGYLYTHAALYVGDGKVAHVMMGGIGQTDFDRLSEEVYVDAYRFNKHGHRLGDKGWSYQPIIDTANKYVSEGLHYAWDHLILTGFLVLTRKIPLDPFAKKWLRIILDHGAEVIFKILDEGKTPMVCTEFVYRCFHDAIKDGKYTLEIAGLSPDTLEEIRKPAVVTESPRTMATVDPKEEQLFEEAKAKFLEGWEKMRHLHAQLGTTSHYWDPTVAACVWPKDLATSPDLRLIGRIRFRKE